MKEEESKKDAQLRRIGFGGACAIVGILALRRDPPPIIGLAFLAVAVYQFGILAVAKAIELSQKD